MVEVVEFGKYMKSLRKKKDLTLIELSKISGVSHPYLSQIENGKTKTVASPDILKKVAYPLGTQYGELMKQAGYIDSYVGWLEDDDEGNLNRTDQKNKVHTNYLIDTDEEEYKMRFKNLGEDLTEEVKRKLSLEYFFEKNQEEKLYYRNIELTIEERQRILEMLKLIFPDRQ